MILVNFYIQFFEILKIAIIIYDTTVELVRVRQLEKNIKTWMEQLVYKIWIIITLTISV